jgi:hypothetical protein
MAPRSRLIDHRATEKDYAAWRKEHMEEVRGWARATMLRLSALPPSDASVALIAAHTGLSEGTVRRYVRKKDMGSRGPLLSTALALKALNGKAGSFP